MKGEGMKKLRARILPTEDWYLGKRAGQEVTVTRISSDCAGSGSHQMRAVSDDGENMLVYGDQLEPVDVSDVPESHLGSLVLRQVWVFCEARNDAWVRFKPSNLARYEEETGMPWVDKRIWDVGRM